MAYREYRPTHRIRNFLLTVFLIAGIALLAALFRGGRPQIALAAAPRAVGRHATISVTCTSPMGIEEVRAYYQQKGRRLPLGSASTGLRRNWWIAPKRGLQVMLQVRAGREDVPGLEDGPAELVIEAWAANLRRSSAVFRQAVQVRSTPPRIVALSRQQYVKQGGAEMVVYGVSPGVTESGVEVAGHLFPGYPVPGAAPGTMFSIFAFPYDAPADARFQLVGRDDAGNETRQPFPLHAFPRRFPARPMVITDAFIQRVVLPIIAATPEISDQHDALKDFLLVNHDLRLAEAQKLAAMSKQSVPEFLWHGAFKRLPSKTEASFADHRYYLYNHQKIDDEYHLGIDLAGTEHMPILAANSGRVLMARYFGIYGNAVLLDHGFGLLSLYGHMQDFAVKPGQMVQQGDLLGHSDTTGMATGDHLHFSMLLDGVQVDPREWWDAHWVHDRIELKLRENGGKAQAVVGNAGHPR